MTTLPQYLSSVRQRLEAADFSADSGAYDTWLANDQVMRHAPTDLAKLLALVEIYGHALEEIIKSEQTECWDLAEEALRKAEEACK